MFDFNNLPYLLLSALAVLIALTIHEFFHALAAYKLGDKTAMLLGRLSLNPLKHLDPFGALCMLLFHFGWAKPVPIDPRNFKKPKRDFALTAVAGPLSNLLIGFVMAFFFALARKYFVYTDSLFLNKLMYNTLYFISVFHMINIGLGVFNLIPIPPFDGSRLLGAFLPDRLYFKIMKYERKIYWGLILWLLVGGYVYNILISIPAIASSVLLVNVLKILSLSQLISDCVGLISSAMLAFWQLFPFLK